MKILFTVQGEGRGHMTQAIALGEMLKGLNHSIGGVAVGVNRHRSLPPFFSSAFEVTPTALPSPAFVFKNNRSLSILGTLSSLLRRLPEYRKSVRQLREMVRQLKPDLIVSFFEPLTGWVLRSGAVRVPVLSVGHQYMAEHPCYVRPNVFRLQQVGMRCVVSMVGHRSCRAALSFYPAKDIPQKNLFVCPPLLRSDLFRLEGEPQENFLLIYLVNRGYCDEIIRWHRTHPEVPLHCFCDRPGAQTEEWPDKTLCFHQLDGQKFLRYMARCRGVACTAGFESVNEAAYLQKPLLMVPIEGHVEQYLNAIDAEAAGLGMYDRSFNLERLLKPTSSRNQVAFRNWVNSAEKRFGELISKVAGQNAVRSPREC